MILVEIKSDSRYPVDKEKIRQMVVSLLGRVGIEEGVEVSIAIVGDRKMRQLGLKFLKEDGIHKVLSFPLENTQEATGAGFVMPAGEKLQLGDIVVSYPQALKQAAAENILVDEAINNLIEHGMRRLLGENHS